MTGAGRPRRARLAAVALVALLLGVGAWTTGPAAAQEDPDPYGSTTTTSAPPGQTPSCRLHTESGAVGSRASVTVRSVARGTTVRVLFDAQQVAQADATGPGSSPRTNVDIDFTVPPSDPGMHEVTAVGADFTASCRTSQGAGFEVVGDSQVLSEQVSRPGGGGGSLARTGVYLGLLVATAIALIVVGRAMLAGSRRRERRTGGLTGARAKTGV